jgi:signal transduction histidine kinase
MDPGARPCFDTAVALDLETKPRPPERSLQELERALAREERVSRALREVGSALGTTLDLDDLLELILGKATELLEADRATLYLLDESTRELVSRIVVGQQVRSIRVKVGYGVAGMVAQTGKPLRIKDAYNDVRFETQWDVLTGYTTTSMLAAPLKNHLGRTIGVIQVLNKIRGEEFTSEDEALLSALGTQAAVAVDNSRLFLSLIQKNKQLLDTKEQLERRVRDLELLFDLERATARATSVEELASAALGKLAAACEARGAALLVASDETGDLLQYLYDAERGGELTRCPVKSGEGLLGAAMATSGTVDVSDAARDARLSERVEGKLGFPVESALAIALEGDDAAIGAIGLFSKRGQRRFTREDASLLRLVSANIATAVRLFWASVARERGERLTTIGRLLSQVIHDFKTPMTVISGYVQLMQDADERALRMEYAEEVLKQFDVVTAMQREVLEFARGERRVFVRKVFLRRFFSDIERQIRHELDGKPIELVVNVDSKAVARFDEGRVARAIHNLARNAIEAMGEHGGTLTIQAGVHDGQVTISVADTGPGIPAEIEGRLFQSFVTAGKEGGTGLGLAIVKKIAEEHGGSVSAQSSSSGARFVMALPIAAAAPSPPQQRDRRGPSGKST